MRSFHRLLPVVLVAMPIVGLTGQRTLAASTVAGPHVTVTPGGASTLNDAVTPLAGDARTLVYLRQPSLARDDIASTGNSYEIASGSPQLVERTASGTTRMFGSLPEHSSGVGSVVESLHGSVFLASGGNHSDDFDFPASNVAHLWRISSGRSWTVKLPTADDVLAAGPDGFVYSAPNGAVKLRTVTGKVTVLARPFGSDDQAVFGASNAAGVEVSGGDGEAAFVRFAAPHRVTPLAATSDPGQAPALQCVAASDQAAACYEVTLEEVRDGELPEEYLLEPLDGSPATVADGIPTHAAAGGCGLGVAGDVLLASCGHFYSQPAGANMASESSRVTGYWSMASAYGEGVASAQGGLYAGPTADDVHELTPAPPSPISVNAFALTPGGVVYADDQPVGSRMGATESVFTRSAKVHGRRLTLGAPRLLSTSSAPVDGSLIAASSSVAVYATPTASAGTVDLHVSGRHPTTLTAVRYRPVQVEGNRVLYVSPTARVGTDFRIYDALTGRSRDGFDHRGGGNFSAALDGHYLAYSISRGAVYRKNLRTGAVEQLAKRFPDRTYFQTREEQVFASGKWVGWNLDYDHVTKHHGEIAHHDSFLVNVNTKSSAVRLPHRLSSLTSAGALLTTTLTSNLPTSYWLRSYAGRVHLLLPRNHYVAGPQIAGGRVAWAGPRGALKVARLYT